MRRPIVPRIATGSRCRYSQTVQADRLAQTYFRKSRARRKAINVLYDERSYADTIARVDEILAWARELEEPEAGT